MKKKKKKKKKTKKETQIITYSLIGYSLDIKKIHRTGESEVLVGIRVQ